MHDQNARSTVSSSRRTGTITRAVAVPVGALALSLALLGCGGEDGPEAPKTPGSPDVETSESSPGSRPSTSSGDPPDSSPASAPTGPPRVVGTVAAGLEVPWGIALLADGDALVTERDSGRLLLLTSAEDGERAAEGSEWRVREVSRLDGGSGSEGGLLGVATRPVDAEKPTGPHEVFVYLTTGRDNRVLRAVFDGGRIDDWEPVLTDVPRSSIHDGGRLAFGPDGHLYVSTGDASMPDLAQDRSSLAGKILRITPEGDPAPGNPFGDSPVWSYGHRNVQGLAWDDEGQLWASEFGQNTWDELNRVETGGNHGWPLAEGDDGASTAPDGTQLVPPVATWPTDEASPSGLAHLGGRLWVAALRGERLWEVAPRDGSSPAGVTDRFTERYGRLRTVVAVGDDRLWLATSNRDGRGDPRGQDDRILEVRLGRG